MLTASQLPELQGSEKQIKWARDLRIDALNAVTAELISLEDQLKKSEQPQERSVIGRVLAAYGWFFAETHERAAWWIENRQGNHHDWINLVYRAMESHLNSDKSLPYDLFYVDGRGWTGGPKRPARVEEKPPVEDDDSGVPDGYCPNCQNKWDEKQCRVCGHCATYTVKPTTNAMRYAGEILDNVRSVLWNIKERGGLAPKSFLEAEDKRLRGQYAGIVIIVALMAIGRQPNLDGLALSQAQLDSLVSRAKQQNEDLLRDIAKLREAKGK